MKCILIKLFLGNYNQRIDMSGDTVEKKANIDRGWAWVVMVTSYLGMIILCTALYMNGVIYVELLERYGEGEAKTSLVGALCSGLLCCLGRYHVFFHSFLARRTAKM